MARNTHTHTLVYTRHGYTCHLGEVKGPPPSGEVGRLYTARFANYSELDLSVREGALRERVRIGHATN